MNRCTLLLIFAVAACTVLVSARPQSKPQPFTAEQQRKEIVQNLEAPAEQDDLKGASSYGYGFYGGYYPHQGYYGGYPYYGGLGYYKLGYPYYGGYYGLYGHHY